MKTVQGCIICDYAELKLDHASSVHIADHTANTWQPTRDSAEKLRDTKQGKEAEAAVEAFFADKPLCYLSYDAFRDDDFNKHAPFDGLLYYPHRVPQKVIDSLKQEINREVAADDVGRISADLREKLYGDRVFTVEIKSTSVKTKAKQVEFKSYDDEQDMQRLIAAILKDDFLTYPKYCRTGDYTWETYCQFVKRVDARFSRLSGRDLEEAVQKEELRHMADCYIRVYMDKEHEKALIVGYITKQELMERPTLKKLWQAGKSENALYLVQSLTNRRLMQDLAK